MTVTLIQSFDGQTDGAAVSSANSGASGNAFDGVTIPGTLAMTYSAEQRAHGNRSLKVSNTDTTGNTGFTYWNASTTPTTYSIRGYLYLTGLPNTLTPVIQHVIGSNRNLLAVTSTGQFSFSDTNGVQYTTTWTASLNLWYRIEATVNLGASGSVLFHVYSLDSTTPLTTLNPTAINMGTGTLTQLRFGKGATAPLVAPYYFDDLAFADSGTAIGPYTSTAPTVTAGAGVAGFNVTLTATASTFDGATPTYSWVQTGGAAVTLVGGSTATPTFTAPSPDTYSFTVTVTDSVGATASAPVSAAVSAPAGTPTAILAMYHDVFVIDATGSTAAFGGALSYSISPSTGVTTLAPGLFAGTMPTTARPYTVTVTEAGNATTASATVTVPGATSTSGTGIHILRATADQSTGGAFL